MQVAFLYQSALVPDFIRDAALDRLPAGYSMVLCDEQLEPSERMDAIGSADFIMLYGASFDADAVARAARVRLLQLLSAGYDRLDLGALRDARIPVANNGGANAQTVAEHAVLLMLAVLKRLPQHHNALARGNWLGLSQGLALHELAGKQVGIVGLGRIGARVARIVLGRARFPCLQTSQAPFDVSGR